MWKSNGGLVPTMIKSLAVKFWRGEGGGRDVLRIALPLIISTSAFTVQIFTDRMFLMWYSSQTISAAMYAGMLYLAITSMLIGTAAYVNVFVAQYDGAGEKKQIGVAVWQGIYFSILAGVIMLAVAAISGGIVGLAGHELAIRRNEETYFRILCLGAIPELLNITLSCFYTGRGRTWLVMIVNSIGVLVNIVLDYALIFGNWNFPQMGIAGAGIATVISNVVSATIFLIFFFSGENRVNFGSAAGWRFERKLFARLMRFGVPSGAQFMLDVLGFAFFIAFVGRINLVSFTATSIAFQINTLAFMPMLGFSTAVSTLVGQALGRNKPEIAQRSTWSATYITIAYMTTISAGYWFFPDIFLYPFTLGTNAAEFEAIRPVAAHLLCFVAIYSLFDTGNIIFSAALKGAGDTRFVMFASLALNWLLLVIPSYAAIKLRGGIDGLYLAWTAMTIYVSAIATVLFVRFLGGKWKQMRVIEAMPAEIKRPVPGLPALSGE